MCSQPKAPKLKLEATLNYHLNFSVIEYTWYTLLINYNDYYDSIFLFVILY